MDNEIQIKLRRKEISADYEKGNISYHSYILKMTKIYTINEKVEFEKIIKNVKLEKSVLSQARDKFPDNNIVKDFSLKFFLPLNLKLNMENKKDLEQLNFFQFLGRNQYNNELSLKEVVSKYKQILDETKSGWDLICEEFNEMIEVTKILQAGSLENKIKSKFNSPMKPIYDQVEIFEEAKRVILKKLSKKGLKNYFYRILIIISAYNEEHIGISDIAVRGSKWRNIKKYSRILTDFSEEKYMNFRRGEVIFVYGNSFEVVRKYKVINFFLNKNYERQSNSNIILNSSRMPSPNMDAQFEIFKDRIR